MGETGSGICAWKQGFYILNSGETEVGQVDKKHKAESVRAAEFRMSGLLEQSVVATEGMPLGREPWGMEIAQSQQSIS